MNIKHGLMGGKINSTARVGPAGWNCCQRERKLAGPWEKPRRILSVEDDIHCEGRTVDNPLCGEDCGLDWQALPYLGDLHLTRLWMTCGQFSVQTKSIRRYPLQCLAAALFSAHCLRSAWRWSQNIKRQQKIKEKRNELFTTVTKLSLFCSMAIQQKAVQ